MKKLALSLLLITLFGCETTKKLNTPNNNTRIARLSGHGYVEILADTIAVIRVYGIIIQNDTEIVKTNFIIANSNFQKELKNYANNYIKFECYSITPIDNDILYVTNGCIEGLDETSQQ